MNVTFLIGNGFDLRLGLKTRYTDMYDGYINESTNSMVIMDFKQALKNDMPKFKTWGDFEIAMGKYAQSFRNAKNYITCVRDFRAYMVKHLKKEQDSFFAAFEKLGGLKSQVLEEFNLSVNDFYKAHTPNVVRSIKNLMHTRGKVFKFNFISFNYTTTFDRILYEYICTLHKDIAANYSDVIHIHGELNKDVVLGVDNEHQINNKYFEINIQTQRAFIKPKFNEMFDRMRVYDAMRTIDNSDVICVYGLSMGNSDMMWNEKIVSWLKSSENHHLYYFSYGTNVYDAWNQDERMDEEDDLKTTLLNRICQSKEDFGSIYDRVHIPIGKDIFDMNLIIKKMDMKKRLDKLSDNLVTV